MLDSLPLAMTGMVCCSDSSLVVRYSLSSPMLFNLDRDQFNADFPPHSKNEIVPHAEVSDGS